MSVELEKEGREALGKPAEVHNPPQGASAWEDFIRPCVCVCVHGCIWLMCVCVMVHVDTALVHAVCTSE